MAEQPLSGVRREAIGEQEPVEKLEIIGWMNHKAFCGRLFMASQAQPAEIANIINPEVQVEFNFPADKVPLSKRDYNPVFENLSFNERQDQWKTVPLFDDAYREWRRQFTNFMINIQDPQRALALKTVLSNNKEAKEFTVNDADALFNEFCRGKSDITNFLKKVTANLASNREIFSPDRQALLPHLQWIASGLFGKGTAFMVTPLIEIESLLLRIPDTVLVAFDSNFSKKQISNPTDDEKKILGLLHKSLPVPQEKAPTPTQVVERAIAVAPEDVPQPVPVMRESDKNEDKLLSPPNIPESEEELLHNMSLSDLQELRNGILSKFTKEDQKRLYVLAFHMTEDQIRNMSPEEREKAMSVQGVEIRMDIVNLRKILEEERSRDEAMQELAERGPTQGIRIVPKPPPVMGESDEDKLLPPPNIPGWFPAPPPRSRLTSAAEALRKEMEAAASRMNQQQVRDASAEGFTEKMEPTGPKVEAPAASGKSAAEELEEELASLRGLFAAPRRASGGITAPPTGFKEILEEEGLNNAQPQPGAQTKELESAVPTEAEPDATIEVIPGNEDDKKEYGSSSIRLKINGKDTGLIWYKTVLGRFNMPLSQVKDPYTFDLPFGLVLSQQLGPNDQYEAFAVGGKDVKVTVFPRSRWSIYQTTLHKLESQEDPLFTDLARYGQLKEHKGQVLIRGKGKEEWIEASELNDYVDKLTNPTSYLQERAELDPDKNPFEGLDATVPAAEAAPPGFATEDLGKIQIGGDKILWSGKIDMGLEENPDDFVDYQVDLKFNKHAVTQTLKVKTSYAFWNSLDLPSHSSNLDDSSERLEEEKSILKKYAYDQSGNRILFDGNEINKLWDRLPKKLEYEMSSSSLGDLLEGEGASSILKDLVIPALGKHIMELRPNDRVKALKDRNVEASIDNFTVPSSITLRQERENDYATIYMTNTGELSIRFGLKSATPISSTGVFPLNTIYPRLDKLKQGRINRELGLATLKAFAHQKGYS